MADWYKEFAKLGHEVIRKSRFSNAMGLPTVLVALVTLSCFALYGITRFWPLLIIASAPIAYFIRAFDYIMKNNPNLLRTEEHEERMLQIQVGTMGEKEDQATETAIDSAEPVTLTARGRQISNVSTVRNGGEQ